MFFNATGLDAVHGQRVHIVGVSPRTGTTLLSEAMATCFDIANVETHEKTCAQLKWTHGVYLTKRPTELGFVRQRLASDRRFWVMCMVRDPRDIIVSRHDKEPDKFWAPLHFWKTEIADLRRVASHPRFLTIRYEDLVMQPDAVQDRIQARLPFLRKTAKFSEFHNFAAPSAKSVKALRGVRPISTSSIGNWKNHLPRVAGQIALHGAITDELIEFGYEPDRSWEALLDGVTPDLADSHFKETERFAALLRQLRVLRRGYPPAVIGFVCDRLRIPFV